MAVTMTALDAPFFWHQFKAGSRWRLLLLPIALIFLISGAWVGSWTTVVAGSLIGSWTLLDGLYPEKSIFRALGMNAARARSQLLMVAAPVVIAAALSYLLFVPGMKGVTGALIAATCGVLFVATHDAVGDQARYGEVESSHIRPSGSLLVQAMWWPTLLGAAIAGAGLSLAIYLAGFIENDTFSSIVAALPVLFFFMWLGTETVMSGLSPLVAHSYGLTRKAWAVHVLAVSVGAGAILGVIASAGSILLPIDHVDVQPEVFILVAVTVVAFGVFAAGTVSKAKALFPAAGFLLWFGVRDLLRFEETAGRVPLGLLIVSAAVALVGCVFIALYVAGKINLTHDNIRSMSSVGGDG
mgnify:CR=1 FL=1